MKELTLRQKEVFAFITGYIKSHSYPPTIREVAEHLSVSVKAAYDHVSALKRKGRIKIEDKRSRTMEVVQTGLEQQGSTGIVEIPILGVVAAGRPILAEENWEGTIAVHTSFLKKNHRYFALTVRGSSMKDAGILDRDTALIQKQNTAKNGDIVVAVVDEAVTIKRFFKETNRIRLQPENPEFNPIYSQDVRILGKLAYVIRSCQ
ncbi:MAG: transcriptional repressor LexA [Spirochaetaceae bacterium]|jgi:repressor LexA|nr:transcriptional repressor LexA [Spirochaetaceae bacterium]